MAKRKKKKQGLPTLFRFVMIMLCLSGLILFVSCDGITNWLGAKVLSQGDTAKLMLYGSLAIAICVGCVVIGVISRISPSLQVACIGLGLTVFSALFTLVSSSSQNASNKISVQSSFENISDMKQQRLSLASEKKAHQSKINECKLDRYFKPCDENYKRLEQINGEISQISRQMISTRSSAQTDISSAVSSNTMLDGDVTLEIITYFRAFLIPILNILLSNGLMFFLFPDSSRIVPDSPIGSIFGGNSGKRARNNKRKQGKKVVILNELEVMRVKRAIAYIKERGHKPTVDAVQEVAKMKRERAAAGLRRYRNAV